MKVGGAGLTRKSWVSCESVLINISAETISSHLEWEVALCKWTRFGMFQPVWIALSISFSLIFHYLSFMLICSCYTSSHSVLASRTKAWNVCCCWLVWQCSLWANMPAPQVPDKCQCSRGNCGLSMLPPWWDGHRVTWGYLSTTVHGHDVLLPLISIYFKYLQVTWRELYYYTQWLLAQPANNSMQNPFCRRH